MTLQILNYNIHQDRFPITNGKGSWEWQTNTIWVGGLHVLHLWYCHEDHLGLSLMEHRIVFCWKKTLIPNHFPNTSKQSMLSIYHPTLFYNLIVQATHCSHTRTHPPTSEVDTQFTNHGKMEGWVNHEQVTETRLHQGPVMSRVLTAGLEVQLRCTMARHRSTTKHEWMNEWTNEQTNERMNEWMNEWISK